MTVPVQITWVAGQIVTAAQLNANVRDAVNFLLNPPAAAVRQTVAQTLTTATTTAITMDTEDRDNDGMHSTSSNTSRLTANTPGWYLAAGGVTFVANATGARTVFWRVNAIVMPPLGGIEIGNPGGASSRVPCSPYQFFLNATDFLEIVANQNSGANLNTEALTGEQSSLSAQWIGSS
jgi:hypothetical protein